MKATWNGTVIAESNDTIVVENITGYVAFWRGVTVSA
jgi:uncharacterized protein (DUF427 family)